MNVRYLEESRGVTDFSPLISVLLYTVDPPFPPLSVPFGRPRGELSLAPPPLPPSHTASVHGTFVARRGACSCRGRQFANSHSDMIDNTKPLCGQDDFYKKM